MADRKSIIFLSHIFLCYLSIVHSAKFDPLDARDSEDPLVLAEGALLVDDGLPKYTHVCEPLRFEMLGLKMADFAYCDKSLSYEVRAKDLVARMTLQEKAEQMGDNTSVGIPRIGLPRYKWWSEALHGVADVGRSTKFDNVVPSATNFPSVIHTAASFNKSLWKKIGEVVSTEARAMFNLGRAGLTFWSPNINVVRDPRWGRVLETPGEDPFVVGTYAVNFVRGLQDLEGHKNISDPNSRPLKVSACCKHFAAYDVENYMGISRTQYDAKVAEQDMVETFNKPFEMCVKEGDVSSVMCSFNRVNGIPTCADHYLLRKLVRQDWNLHGYIVADCDSITEIVKSHKWLDDKLEDASAQVLKAGMDLDCGSSYLSLPNAVKEGKVKESDMDQSLIYLHVVLMRLGFYDGMPSLMKLGKKNICNQEHIELSAEAARQGTVLLKNQNQVLPLDSGKIRSLALIGPHANATDVMIGNYAGVPCKIISPLEAFSEYTDVNYKMGCVDVRCKNDSLIFQAAHAAKKADATILFVGISLDIEAEWVDRKDLLLPGYQTQLVKAVSDAAKGPVILVVMSGGVIDISFAKNNAKISSILWTGYPGEQGGKAIADIVFGKYNPSGRLPLTWYENSYVKDFPMTSMALRPVEVYPGRTYKFFNGSTVFPFGYGLSYTSFKYEHKATEIMSVDIKLNKFQHCHGLLYKDGKVRNSSSLCASVSIDDLTCKNIEISFEFRVENVGHKDGSNVVLVYSVPPKEIEGAPIKQLVEFQRVHVGAKESKTVKFVLNACKALSIVDLAANTLLPSGLHRIVVGDKPNSISIPVKVSYKR